MDAVGSGEEAVAAWPGVWVTTSAGLVLASLEGLGSPSVGGSQPPNTSKRNGTTALMWCALRENTVVHLAHVDLPMA